MELLVIFAILAILSLVVFTLINQVLQRGKVVVAKVGITQYVTLLEAVKSDINYYPPVVDNTLESLAYTAAPTGYENGWRGPYLKKVPIDPWKKGYFYRLKGGTFLPRWTVFHNNPIHKDSFLSFDAGDFGGPGGQITIFNIKSNGTSNRVYLNNEEIVHPDEFKQQVYEIQKDVSFFPSGTLNVIRVTLLGNPNAEIEIDIGSVRHPKTTYSVGSYGADNQPGGIGFARDLTWTAGQSSPGFN